MSALEKNKRAPLGRGLSSLLGDQDSNEDVGNYRMISISLVHANEDQPRKQFSNDKLDELVASVREKGVLSPILVRDMPGHDGHYEIIAGERRWRASQLAGLDEVPVIVKDVTDVEAMEIALIENVNREDLTILEEAEGYQRLMTACGHTQESLAKVLGKSRSYIANSMRLLQLPNDVKDMLNDGRLSAGHARTLVTMPEDQAIMYAQKATEEKLTVRDVEKLVSDSKKMNRIEKAVEKGVERGAKQAIDETEKTDIRSLEKTLSEKLGLDVKISHKKGDKGDIVIRYQSLDDLDHVCHLITSATEH